jgi:3-phosphoshikimate 1-carboxyvinyltransferase
MRIVPARRLRGEVARLPGDKSISHRAALLAALAAGSTRVSNFATSADCASTLRCLEALGVSVGREGGGAIRVEGAGLGPGAWAFREPAGPLDCGNSGTTMRLLAGVLAAQPFASTLTGDESLSRRPMRRVVEPLERMGARLSTEGGHAPLGVEGRRPLRAIDYELEVASAQVKSCILLAGLGASGRTRVGGPLAGTRDHTERMLRHFGVEVGVEGSAGGPAGLDAAAWVEGPAALAARDVEVPGDPSSAAFLLFAAALLPGSELRIRNVGLNPTRTAYAGLLDALAAVAFENRREASNEPVGDVVVRRAERPAPRPHNSGGVSLRGQLVTSLIDELPLLAVVGTQIEGGLEVRDATELRVKESDRISSVVTNLRAMGARAEEFADGFRVEGPQRLRGARLDSFGDHRVAMAFAVAALAAEGETVVEGAEECVAVSFPEFFPLLESLVER